MARTRIEDLPKDKKISKEEMKNVVGGAVDCFFKIDGVPGESVSTRIRLFSDTGPEGGGSI